MSEMIGKIMLERARERGKRSATTSPTGGPLIPLTDTERARFDRIERAARDVLEGVVWRDEGRGVEMLDPGAVSTAALRRLDEALGS